jgi:hypothetical protein
MIIRYFEGWMIFLIIVLIIGSIAAVRQLEREERSNQ